MEQVQVQRTAVVAAASTAAAAELVATTLEAHGLHAWTEAYAGVYPSLEWVEGHRVRVAAEDRGEARRVLAALDRTDASVVPDVDEGHEGDGDRPRGGGDGGT